MIVERTLVLLKGWWRCLQKEPRMIAACCILHNICIENGEPDPKIGDSHDNYDNNDDFVDGGASSNADAVKDVLIRNLLNCKKKMLY